jgi:hypothetical protein
MGCASFQAVSPAALVIDSVTLRPDRLLISARPTAPDAARTVCGERSSQIHSCYERRLLDLPSHRSPVHLLVQVRRCRCVNAGCGWKIFGELLDADIAPEPDEPEAKGDSLPSAVRAF